MIGPHRVPRDAGIPVAGIVVAAIVNVGLVVVAVIGPRHAPQASIVQPDLDPGAEPTTTSPALETALESPAPFRCVDIDAVRVIRGHVYETLDHRLVEHDESPTPIASILVMDAGSQFVMRFGPGELRAFQRQFVEKRFHDFAHGMHADSTQVCEHSVWLERWEPAWGADSRQLRRFTAMIDALE